MLKPVKTQSEVITFSESGFEEGPIFKEARRETDRDFDGVLDDIQGRTVKES